MCTASSDVAGLNDQLLRSVAEPYARALAAQDEYIRLRPGFSIDYPLEVNPDTLRNLVVWWKKLGREPQLCRDLDICAFLDRMEKDYDHHIV